MTRPDPAPFADLAVIAAQLQARYAADRRAWALAVGRRAVEIPIAEPGPLTVDPIEAE